MTSVGVIIATFGDEAVWGPLADRAEASAEYQTRPADEIVRFHKTEANLADVRNGAVDKLSTEWVIVLDADDELHPNYVEAMLEGSGEIRWPSTIGILNGELQGEPHCNMPGVLEQANFITIGAMFQRGRFLRVGGFRELPVLDDWDLWLRMWLDGATYHPCPSAIYCISFEEGRHRRNEDPQAHGVITADIQQRYWPLVGARRARG